MVGRYVFRKKIYSLLALLLDSAGYSLAWLGGFKRKKAFGRPENVLVVRLDHLGDALLASGVPEALKKSMPGIRITFLTSSLGAAVLKNNPFVDEVIVYDAPWFSRKKNPVATKLGLAELGSMLSRNKFDLALSLRGDARENFLIWKAGIARRVGYGITGGGFFLNEEVPYRFGVHENEHALDILRNLGIDAQKLTRTIYFSNDEELEFSSRFCEWGIIPDRQFIGFQPDAGATAKDWPEENITAFFKKFAASNRGVKMILLGADTEKAERLMKFTADEKIESCFLNLVGKTSLRELFYLLKRVTLFIGPDSGPSHAAAGMGVPTLFLYSGTNEFDRWRPLSDSATVIRHEVPCSSCGRAECPVAGHPCMSLITPEQVSEWLNLQKIGAC